MDFTITDQIKNGMLDLVPGINILSVKKLQLMTSKIVAILILSLTLFTATAQVTNAPVEDETSAPATKKKGLDPSRLYFGGNFGLTFGNFTFVNVSPQVGYRLNEQFSVGTGINFIYQSSKYNYGSNNYDKSEYAYVGLGVFGRFNPIKFLLLNVQPEMNYVWGNTKYVRPQNSYEYKQEGKFVPSLLAGVGAALPTGGRGALIAMIQYDLIQNDLSPYGKNPFFSFGFNF